MAKRRQYYIRKSHRYLGLILGIQFLIWTISGLYFSWTNIHEIHGDHQRRPVPVLQNNFQFISPAIAINNLDYKVDSISSIQTVNILAKPYYKMEVYSGNELKKVLADAITGKIRPAITKEESILIAKENFYADASVRSAVYLPSTGQHHEYRSKPLPAWAVNFDHPTNTTVYISAEGGKVESFRINKWRIFDFLWMGHTMGYEDRDDINNWLLRIFSIFGLVTVLSGFLLFFVSRRRRLKNNFQQ